MPRTEFIEKISIHYIIPHFREKYKPKNGGGEKNLKKIRSYPLRLAILIPGGMLAGFINGFLGTGGGILLVFLLGLVLPDGEDKDNAARDRFATVIAVIIPLSLVSAMIYSDSVPTTLSAPFILPGMLGGAAGGFLLDRINVKWLKKIFALMVIWAGICFMK